jgi:hypothetical protein
MSDRVQEPKRRVVVVTFATKDYENSAEVLRHSARLNGDVDGVEIYSPSSKCVVEFYGRTGFSERDRGAGWWGWKPRIILDAASKFGLKHGDVVVYMDAAMIAESSVRDMVDRLLPRGEEVPEVCLFSLGEHVEKGYTVERWTHPRALEAAGATDEERKAYQVNAAVQAYRVCPGATEFLWDYAELCETRDFVEDAPGFSNHRHDQSALSILAARKGAWSRSDSDGRIVVARDPTQYGAKDAKLSPGDVDRPLVDHHRARIGNIPRVAVVIPTTGNEEMLEVAVRSSATQSVPGVTTWIVADGPEALAGAEAVASRWRSRANVEVLALPKNTGANGWNGHRVYGAVPWLTDADYVAFLDQDNFFDEDHLHSMLSAIAETSNPRARWAFSLRRIVNQDGSFACDDRCESLGLLHHTCISEDDYLVDANCYLVERSLAIETSACWNNPARPSKGLEVDRALVRALASAAPFAIVKKSTVSYRLGGNRMSVARQFFERGNAALDLDLTKPLLYLFLFNAAATKKYFETRKDETESHALDEWQPALPRRLSDHFCVVNGFSNVPVIPEGSNVLCVICNPGELPLDFLATRKDLRRAVYTVESPNVRHAAQWKRDFLEKHFDAALTYWDGLLDAPGKLETVFCPQNCHHLDLDDPLDRALLRENRGTEKSVVMVLERRPQLRGAYEIDGIRLECLDPLREKLVSDLTNATVVGRGWDSYAGNPRLKVASVAHRDADEKSSVDWYQNHTFALIVENTNAKGYVSEKLYDALIAGAIPLYWGSNVSKRLEETVQGLRELFIDITDKSSAQIQKIIDDMTDADVEALRAKIYEKREDVLRAVGQKAFADAVLSVF